MDANEPEDSYDAAIKLIEEAGAKVAGIGILIEKSFQPGREKIDSAGYDVYSLVRVNSLKDNKIEILKQYNK